MTDTPNPGSPEAIKQGCTCPETAINYGEGIMMGGERLWWYTDNCPLHKQEQEGNE